MFEIVSQTIDRVYKKKDYEFFRESCKKKFELFEEVKLYILSNKFSLNECSYFDYPEVECYIELNDYQQENFKISYKTILKVSKVCPLFYLHHEFDLEDSPNIDRIYPLDAFGSSPYSLGQRSLEQKIVEIFTQQGYTQMTRSDMDEALEEFKMPDGVTIFGRQITVQNLLFRDLFGVFDSGDESID